MVKSMTKARIAFSASGICLAIVVLISGAYLYMGAQASHPTYAQPELYFGIFPSDQPQTKTDDGYPIIDWDYWISINPDVVGWITVPDTNIDYPIVQARDSDPDYYLTHDIYGNYNIFGAIYLDAACAHTGGMQSPNTVIFGHHMNDGSMFADFARYSALSYLHAHDKVLIQTPDTKTTLYAKAANIIPGWQASKRTEFASQEDLSNYLVSQTASASAHISDIDLQATDAVHAYSFVTCSYNRWSSNERTIVYAW